MTLCRYRPARAYDAQYLLERNDVGGLLKKLDEAVWRMGEDGLASTAYYVGAHLAFEVLFEGAREAGDGKVDKWTDFMRLFERALEELEDREEGRTNETA